MNKVLGFISLLIIMCSAAFSQAPTVSLVYPSSSKGSVNVIISGTNFTGATSVILRSGVDAEVPFKVMNPSTIVAYVELSSSKYINGRNGAVFIVTTPDGSNTTSPNFDYTPIANSCASFVYGDWEPCTNGVQKRPYIASPSACNTKPPKDSIQRKCQTPDVKFLKFDANRGTVSIKCNVAGTMDAINSAGNVAETFTFLAKSDDVDVTSLPEGTYTIKAYDESITISTSLQLVEKNRLGDTVFINGRFGTAPYTYSVNSTSFFSGSLMTSLVKGTYTLRCKDATGKIAALTVSIPKTSIITNNDCSFVRGTGYIPEPDSITRFIPLSMSADLFYSTEFGSTAKTNTTLRVQSRDRTPPTVAFINPSNNASVTGSVGIRIDAVDNVAVTTVDLLIDGNLFYRWSNPTTTSNIINWNTTSATRGVHVLSTTAYDAAGNNSSSSIQINITPTPPPPAYLSDITPPTSTITWPTNGAVYTNPDTIQLKGILTDNYMLYQWLYILYGPTGRELTRGGALLYRDSLSTYQVNYAIPMTRFWTTPFDSCGGCTGFGMYKIRLYAIDFHNNMDSADANIMINSIINRDTTFPASFRLKVPPVMDQGGQGSCSACSFTYGVCSTERYYRNNDTYYSFSTNIYSPRYSFNLYKLGYDTNFNYIICPQPGCNFDPCMASGYTGLRNLAIDSGQCRWAYDPYNPYYRACPDTIIPPIDSRTSIAKNDARANRLPGIPGGSPYDGGFIAVRTYDVKGLKYALLRKHPLLVGFNMSSNYSLGGNPRGYWLTSGGISAAHANFIIGWDDNLYGGCWIMQNSWGTNWGDEGLIYVSYDVPPINFGSIMLFLNY
jgi:hypothetical protein